jgi:chromosome partitioning protein
MPIPPILLIASAKGGTAKSTTAARLAESLARRGYRPALIDLSPYPTTRHLLAAKGLVRAVPGRSATSELAVLSLLRPFEAKNDLILVDTMRFDDSALDPWHNYLSALILTTRLDRFAVRALPACWPTLDRLRTAAPRMKPLGVLPVLTRPNDAAALRELRRAEPDQIIPTEIPFDPAELRRSQLGIVEGVPEPPSASPSGIAYDQLAAHVANQLGLPAPAAAEPPQTGFLSKLWQAARKRLGPAVTVVGR